MTEEMQNMYFSPSIVKNKYEIDESNGLIKVKGVTGVLDAGNIAKSVAKNAAKATLALGTGGLSLLSKKGRSFSKGKVDGGSLIIQLREITGYDLVEHTGSRTDSKKNTKIGGAATSILGIGVGGAKVGTKGLSDRTAVIEDLCVTINTNNLQYPSISVSFLDSMVTRDAEEYRQGLSNANELITTLDVLKQRGALGIAVEKQPASDSISDEALDKLKKIKELLDLGVLTQEEFEAKKAEILNK